MFAEEFSESLPHCPRSQAHRVSPKEQTCHKGRIPNTETYMAVTTTRKTSMGEGAGRVGEPLEREGISQQRDTLTAGTAP